MFAQENEINYSRFFWYLFSSVNQINMKMERKYGKFAFKELYLYNTDSYFS